MDGRVQHFYSCLSVPLKSQSLRTQGKDSFYLAKSVVGRAFWLSTSPRCHQGKSWSCDQREGHDCWVTKNQQRCPTPSRVHSAYKIFFRYISPNHTCLSDSLASTLSHGALAAAAVALQLSPASSPSPPPSCQNSPLETYTDLVTLLCRNLRWLPTKECHHGPQTC